MIIYVKQACDFFNKDGEKYHCDNGFIGCPPDWVADDAFFRALAADGKITVHVDSKSVDAEAEKEEAKGRKKK